MVDLDILVVGAGPAGLLAATYLSAEHRVAVIDRTTLGHETSKFWVTSERRLQRHDLDQCVLSRPKRMIGGTFLGGQFAVHGDFAVTDDEHILRVLMERCRERGVKLIDNCCLLNLIWTADSIRAQTTKGTFSARVVADATGGGSPIASTFRLHRVDGFYTVYCGLLREITLSSSDIVLGYVGQLGDPPPVFEVVPTSENSAYCVLLVYSETLLAPSVLAAAFENHCRHNPFFEMTQRSIRGAEKAGAIPIGRTSRRRLRGVVSLGEAGLIQPPLMGTAFNEVLEHTASTCAQISRALTETVGIPALPRNLYPARKRMQDRLQLLIIQLLLSANVERLDRIVRVMSKLPEELIFNLLSNELTWSQLLHIALRMPCQLMLGRNGVSCR